MAIPRSAPTRTRAAATDACCPPTIEAAIIHPPASSILSARSPFSTAITSDTSLRAPEETGPGGLPQILQSAEYTSSVPHPAFLSRPVSARMPRPSAHAASEAPPHAPPMEPMMSLARTSDVEDAPSSTSAVAPAAGPPVAG